MKQHNPSNLSPEQYEAHLGFRLLDEDEVYSELRHVVLTQIEMHWSGQEGKWVGDSCTGATDCAFRTRLSRSELAAARGLTPKASDPEKADAIEAWQTTLGYQSLTALELDPEDPVADLERRLKAAFLAGQRSEREEIGAKLTEQHRASIKTSQKARASQFENLLDFSNGWKGAADLMLEFLASREPKGVQ